MPALIASIHATLSSVAGGAPEPVAEQEPGNNTSQDLDPGQPSTTPGQTTEFGENVRLQRGDVINVQYKPRRFSTFGALNAVAQVDMPAGPMTLTGAMSKVGGLNTTTANARRVLVFEEHLRAPVVVRTQVDRAAVAERHLPVEAQRDGVLGRQAEAGAGQLHDFLLDEVGEEFADALRQRGLEALGERQISIDCDVIQADGGTRTAAITGAWIALHDCLKWMETRSMIKVEKVLKDHIAAVSCGIFASQPVIDLDYLEDSAAETDANFVMTGSGGIVEIVQPAVATPEIANVEAEAPVITGTVTPTERPRHLPKPYQPPKP